MFVGEGRRGFLLRCAYPLCSVGLLLSLGATATLNGGFCSVFQSSKLYFHHFPTFGRISPHTSHYDL